MLISWFHFSTGSWGNAWSIWSNFPCCVYTRPVTNKRKRLNLRRDTSWVTWGMVGFRKHVGHVVEISCVPRAFESARWARRRPCTSFAPGHSSTAGSMKSMKSMKSMSQMDSDCFRLIQYVALSSVSLFDTRSDRYSCKSDSQTLPVGLRRNQPGAFGCGSDPRTQGCSCYCQRHSAAIVLCKLLAFVELWWHGMVLDGFGVRKSH